MGTVLFHSSYRSIHVLACLFLIVVVLLQTGKGADMGAVFGGGSQTLFGSSGAGNFLTRLTTGDGDRLHADVAHPDVRPDAGLVPPARATAAARRAGTGADRGSALPRAARQRRSRRSRKRRRPTPPAAEAPAPTPPAGNAAPAEGNAPAAGGTAPAPTPAPATK